MRSRAIASGDRGFSLRVWGGVAIALAVALLLASCGAEEGQQGGDGGAQAEGNGGAEAGQTRPVERITLEDLTANPKEFYGARVAVSGEVIEVVEPGAVRIEDDGSQLLVVGVEQMPQIVSGNAKAVNEGDRIKVNGRVRQFDKEEIQQSVDYGMDDNYFDKYEGDPTLMAYSVKVLS